MSAGVAMRSIDMRSPGASSVPTTRRRATTAAQINNKQTKIIREIKSVWEINLEKTSLDSVDLAMEMSDVGVIALKAPEGREKKRNS